MIPGESGQMMGKDNMLYEKKGMSLEDLWRDVRLLAHSESSGEDVFSFHRVVLDPSLLTSSLQNTINYCEPLQIKISIHSEVVLTFVLEFCGFLTIENHQLDANCTTINCGHNNISRNVMSLILHSEFISLVEEQSKMLGTGETATTFKCIVEPLLTNSQHIPVNTNNDVEIYFSMLCPKDSTEILNFMERIELCSEKSIFKKQDAMFNSLIKTKLLGRYVVDGQVTIIDFMGVKYPIVIHFSSTQQHTAVKKCYVHVTRDVCVKFIASNQILSFSNRSSLPNGTNDQLHYYMERTKTFIKKISSDTIGGLDEPLGKITEILDAIFHVSPKFCTHIPKTILLWGLQGTGKSTILTHISEEYKERGVRVRFASGTSFSTDLFSNLQHSQEAGILICLDDIENMGKSFSHLLSCLQQITFNNNSGRVAVIAVSNRNIEELDESVRQSGHFERDFYIPIPTSLKDRTTILNIQFRQFFPTLATESKEVFMNNLVRFTPGYVGRDIQRLFKMAQFHALSNLERRLDTTDVTNLNEKFTLSETSVQPQWRDFEYALRVVKPSQLNTENLFTVLRSNEQEHLNHDEFEDIGGYHDIKQRCKELLYWPLEFPESFQRYGLPTCCGILLHGPSGCGKSLLTRSLASLGKMNYISLKCPELFSKYVGETEKLIRYIFKRARQLSPCVLVFDEIDALAPRRELQNNASVTDSGSAARALSQLLNEMDGIQNRKQVFIIGCTNRIQLIDQALLRPGRLDQILEMGEPNEDEMIDIFNVYKRKMPFSSTIDIAELVAMIKDLGWTGAKIHSWCREAALQALRENIDSCEIEFRHFQSSFSSMNQNL